MGTQGSWPGFHSAFPSSGELWLRWQQDLEADSSRKCPTQKAHERGGLTNHLTHARYSSGAKGPDRVGGVLLGLSSGSILQSQLPPLGVQGRRPSSKSLCHQATEHYETQMMFFLRMALFGWKAWHGDGQQAGVDKQGQIRMLTL